MADAPAETVPESGPSPLAERLAGMRLQNLSELKQVPIIRQLALLIGVALAVAAGLTMFFWSQKPEFVPVFPALSAEDSTRLAETLSGTGIQFKIDPLTGLVTVPPDMVNPARLRAASRGIPAQQGGGFELIQGEQGFGTSQFIESARYQHAVETELARTISSLQPVKAARVHLAVPKPSAFTQGREAASASVVVDLQGGMQLEPNQVSAIEHLVASSIPGMDIDRVSVIDQFGKLLSRQEAPTELEKSTEQYPYARRAEGDYQRRIEELLAPMIGMGKVSAKVSVDFDFSQLEEATESYEPKGSVRSERIQEERNTQNTPEGIPGALSNSPPVTNADPNAGPTPVGQNAAANVNGQSGKESYSSDETRNFEIGRQVSHRRGSPGEVRRLTAAVLVDYVMRPDATGALVPTALTDAELAKVEALVKQAVGFSEARGDAVTVQTAPFTATEIAAVDPLPIWERPEFQPLFRYAFGALVVIVLLLMVVRPFLRALVGPAPKGEDDEEEDETLHVDGELGDGQMEALANLSEARDALALDQPGGPYELANSAAATEYEQRLAAARAAVTQDPKRVAQVIKSWLNEDA